MPLTRSAPHAVNFANNLNPTLPKSNVSLLSGLDWQPWNSSAEHPLLTFVDPAPQVAISSDTFREGPMQLLSAIAADLAKKAAQTINEE